MSAHPVNEDFYDDFPAAKRWAIHIAFESAYRVDKVRERRQKQPDVSH
jgi:hypothetical protein